MRTTFPRRADAVRGGELTHSFARSREANSDWLEDWPTGNPWRNGTRIPVRGVGCVTFMSLANPAFGAPFAMASTAATKSSFFFIDEFPFWIPIDGVVAGVGAGITPAEV